MSEFIAVTFDDADQALQALASVRSLEKEDKIHLKDTAVVTKDAAGKVSVKNEASSGTETGAVVGGILGAMLFLIFPVAGIIGGAVVGGLIGRAVSPGVDGGFVKDVAADLPNGGSALFLLIKDGDVGLLIAAMRRYEGRIKQTTLDEEAEQALEDSLR
jgi:uncharacterized membrane protein